MNDIVSQKHKDISNSIKKVMAIYREAEDLINIGAYVKGSNEKIDYAIAVIDRISEFIEQQTQECYNLEEVTSLLGKVLK